LRILLVPDRQPTGFGQLERHAKRVPVPAVLRVVIVVALSGDGIDLSDGVRRLVDADSTLNHDVLRSDSSACPVILWQTDLPGAPGGGVISYLIDGKQRVTFVAGTRTNVLPVPRRAQESSSSVCKDSPVGSCLTERRQNGAVWSSAVWYDS
jgi:hypothetical protein